MNPKSPAEPMLITEDIAFPARSPNNGEIPSGLCKIRELNVVLDSVPANIAILNREGLILHVNRGWNSFARENGISPDSVAAGVNYLTVCDMAIGADSAVAKTFASGVRAVIAGQMQQFSMEYPCHSPEQQRWFVGYVTAMSKNSPGRAVIAHVDITAQKLVEEKIRVLNEELELRVIERTIELSEAVNVLEKEVILRKQLEQEVLDIAERETSRIGQDLHDGLCQTLSGIAFFAKALQSKLRHGEFTPPAASCEMEKIADLIKDAVGEARGLASGMCLAALEQVGLVSALKLFAKDTAERFQIKCEFISAGPVVLTHYAATHLYRITQEALNNAIKHGQATMVRISLFQVSGHITLKIADNGHGRVADTQAMGMGMKTMNFRARVIGGSFDIQPRRRKGLTVTVCLKING